MVIIWDPNYLAKWEHWTRLYHLLPWRWDGRISLTSQIYSESCWLCKIGFLGRDVFLSFAHAVLVTLEGLQLVCICKTLRTIPVFKPSSSCNCKSVSTNWFFTSNIHVVEILWKSLDSAFFYFPAVSGKLRLVTVTQSLDVHLGSKTLGNITP